MFITIEDWIYEYHPTSNLDKCFGHVDDGFVISFVGVDVFNVIIWVHWKLDLTKINSQISLVYTFLKENINIIENKIKSFMLK